MDVKDVLHNERDVVLLLLEKEIARMKYAERVTYMMASTQKGISARLVRESLERFREKLRSAS